MTLFSVVRSTAARCATVVVFALVATPLFAITIDGESRLTEGQFAKKNGKSVADVRKTFAASGTLECVATQRRGRLVGRLTTRLTAQLTGKNDVIVTAAHAFIDPKTCERKMRAAQCTFKIHDGRRSVVREVELVAMGNIRCDKGVNNSGADWLVLKLSAPVASVVPYDLGERREIIFGARVWSVAGQSKDFFLNGRYAPFNKTIDDCSVKDMFGAPGALTMLSTDCDTAQGNSGGALLARSSSGSLRLLAITVSSSVNGDGPPPRKAPRDSAYNKYSWASYAVPLTGAFRTALEKAVGLPPSTPQVVFPTLDSGTIAFPSIVGGKPLFPAVSRPAGATAENGAKEGAMEDVRGDANEDAKESVKEATSPD